MDILAERIGDAVRSRREALGINQAELARLGGVTPSMVSQIEIHRRIPSVPVLVKIACALKVNLDYLVGLSDLKEFVEARDPAVQAAFRKFSRLSAKHQQRFLSLFDTLVNENVLPEPRKVKRLRG